MWTKAQKAVVGVCVFAAVALFVAGLWTAKKAAEVVAPPPESLAVWLPSGAEIRTTKEVQPGTFSITLPLEEFKQRFPTSGLVSYPSQMGTSPSGGDEPITIWRVEPGSAVFYKTVQRIPYPRWSYFTVKTLRLEGGFIVAYPEPENVLTQAARMLFLLAAWAGVIAVGVVFIPPWGSRARLSARRNRNAGRMPTGAKTKRVRPSAEPSCPFWHRDHFS